MNKVVYNVCFGGFSLSKAAAVRLVELGMQEMVEEIEMSKQPSMSFMQNSFGYRISRHDPRVVQVVEELGSEAASGRCAKLKVIEIYGNRYRIDEYDGQETVVEPDTDYLEWIEIKP